MANAMTAQKGHLRLGFAKAYVFVPVAVYNAANDIQLAAVQLRQLIG